MIESKKIEDLTNQDIAELSKDSMGRIDLTQALILFLEREHAIKIKSLDKISDVGVNVDPKDFNFGQN